MLTRLCLVLLLIPCIAAARTFNVGPDRPLATPSAAARVAQDGDTILIDPGKYYDCAVWNRNGLTIAGTAPGVTITDTTCQGKALFVVTGNDTTIQDLSLARARVPDRNGAGIRLEGQGLSLRDVRFINNEVGLLFGGSGGTIHIGGCTFESGGVGGDRPTYAVWVAAAKILRIENSRFEGIQGGQISTAAVRTELTGNTIGTGTGENPSVAVMASGGALLLDGNHLAIGPAPPRFHAAILAMGGGTPTLRNNTLTNTTGRPIALLLNWTRADPILSGNTVGPTDTVVSTEGAVRHMASVMAHTAVDGARGAAGWIKRGLGGR